MFEHGESKGLLKERLRREGRWEAAYKRREELKRGGMSPTDAWELIRAEFEPLDGTDVGAPAEKGIAGAANGAIAVPAKKRPKGFKKKDCGDLTKVNFREVTTWVFNAIGVEDINLADAPSPGAWSMFQWVRGSTTAKMEFYRVFCSKLLPSRRELDEDERFTDDGSKLIEAIDRLLQARADAILPSGAERRDGESAVSADGS